MLPFENIRVLCLWLWQIGTATWNTHPRPRHLIVYGWLCGFWVQSKLQKY